MFLKKKKKKKNYEKRERERLILATAAGNVIRSPPPFSFRLPSLELLGSAIFESHWDTRWSCKVTPEHFFFFFFFFFYILSSCQLSWTAVGRMMPNNNNNIIVPAPNHILPSYILSYSSLCLHARKINCLLLCSMYTFIPYKIQPKVSLRSMMFISGPIPTHLNRPSNSKYSIRVVIRVARRRLSNICV